MRCDEPLLSADPIRLYARCKTRPGASGVLDSVPTCHRRSCETSEVMACPFMERFAVCSFVAYFLAGLAARA